MTAFQRVVRVYINIVIDNIFKAHMQWTIVIPIRRQWSGLHYLLLKYIKRPRTISEQYNLPVIILILTFARARTHTHTHTHARTHAHTERERERERERRGGGAESLFDN